MGFLLQNPPLPLPRGEAPCPRQRGIQGNRKKLKIMNYELKMREGKEIKN